MAKKSVPVRSQVAGLVNEIKGSSLKDQIQELVDLMNERRGEASYVTKLNPKTGKLDKTDASRHTRSLSFYDDSIKKLVDMLYPTLGNNRDTLNELISDLSPSDQLQLKLAFLPNVRGELGDGTLQEAPVSGTLPPVISDEDLIGKIIKSTGLTEDKASERLSQAINSELLRAKIADINRDLPSTIDEKAKDKLLKDRDEALLQLGKLIKTSGLKGTDDVLSFLMAKDKTGKSDLTIDDAKNKLASLLDKARYDADKQHNRRVIAYDAEKRQQQADDMYNKAEQAKAKLAELIADKKLAEDDVAQSREGLSSSRFNANTAGTDISEALAPYFTVSSIKNPDPLQVGVRSYTLKPEVKNAIAQLALSDLLGSDEFSKVKVSVLRKALEDRIKQYTDEAEAIPFAYIKENLGNLHSDDELAMAKKAADDEKDEKEKVVKQAIYQRMLDRNAEINENNRNINQNKINQLEYQKKWAEVRNAQKELDKLDPYGNLARQEERFNKLESEYHPEYVTDEDKLRQLLSFANNGDANDPILSQLIQAYDIPFNKHKAFLLQGDIDQARREAIDAGKLAREAAAEVAPKEEGIGADINIIQTPFGNDRIFVKNTSKANGTRMGGMAVGIIGKDGKAHIYHADLNVPNSARREILKPYGGNIDKALHDPRFVSKYVQIDNIHNGIGVSVDPKTGKKIYGPSFDAKDLKGLGNTIVSTISGMPATLFRPENRYKSDRYNKYNESMDDFIKYGNYNPTTEQGYKGLFDYSYNDLVDFFAERNAKAAGASEVDELTQKRAKSFVDSLIKQHKVDVVKDDYTDPKTGKVYTKGTLLPSEWNLVDSFYVNKRPWIEKRDAGDVANHFGQLKDHLQKRYLNLVDGIFEAKQLANDVSLSQEQRDKYKKKLDELTGAKKRFDANYKLEFDDDGNVKSFVQTFKPGKNTNAINQTSKYNKKSGGLPSAIQIFGWQENLSDVEGDLKTAKADKEEKAKALAEAVSKLELFMRHYNAADRNTKKMLQGAKTQLTANKNEAKKAASKATSTVAKLEKKQGNLSNQIGEFNRGKANANADYLKSDSSSGNGLTINSHGALMNELGSIWG